MTIEFVRIISEASPERAAILALLLCLVLAAAAIRWLAAQLAEARAELREDYNLQRALLARLGGTYDGNQTLVQKLATVPQTLETGALPDAAAVVGIPGLKVGAAPRKTYTAPRVTAVRKLYTAPALWPLDEPDAIHRLESMAVARTAG